MQLKRQPIEASEIKKHYSKENNTSKKTIPRQEISPVIANGICVIDHVKYEGQVRSQHLLCVQFSH